MLSNFFTAVFCCSCIGEKDHFIDTVLSTVPRLHSKSKHDTVLAADPTIPTLVGSGQVEKVILVKMKINSSRQNSTLIDTIHPSVPQSFS